MAATSIKIRKKAPVISLSDGAVAKVKELIAQEADASQLFLRVAVAPGGCSGYSYDMFFDTEMASDDLDVEFDTFKVVIDPASAELIKGSTLEFQDGLSGAGFHIVNPNATKTCGCGSSFS
ncbi:MAG: HesB/IscA family protein [Ferrimicrobium sp.]